MCGLGKIVCEATYNDGSKAHVKIERLAKYVYRIKVLTNKEGRIRLNIQQIQSMTNFF